MKLATSFATNARTKMNNRQRLAEFVSFITNPALIVTVSLFILTSYFADSLQQFWRWFGVGAFLLLGPSFAFALYTWKKEGRVDIDMTNREDRIVPLLLSSLGALFGGYLIQTRIHNDSLLLISYVLVAMLALLTIVTFVWKISLHAATLTAAVSLLVVFRGPEFSILYLFIIPVAWARLTLKQHSRAQLTAGALVGAAITFMAVLLFRS